MNPFANDRRKVNRDFMKKAAETVLFYHFDTVKFEAVQTVMRKLGITCRILPEESWKEKIGFLLGKKGFEPSRKDLDTDYDFPDEVMILYNIKGKRLDQVLLTMREIDMPPIRYKAIVTPFNILWTLQRLCETMKKEHAYMTERGKIDDGKA